MARAIVRLSWLACWLGLLACGPGTGPERPDVLLVTLDTTRADRIGVYGGPPGVTPTLDALAAEGSRFSQAFATAPLTLPSHASMLTGLYPPRHGVRHNGIFRLDASFDTLPERLEEAGYETGAVLGAYVLAREFGLAQGFEHYDDRIGGPAAAHFGSSERPARDVSDAALDWLEQTRNAGPRFLWLHYFDPHAEYRAPEPWAERFASDPYSAEIAYVDAELGRVIDSLRQSGRLERTLVVVTADHGESLGEHGETTHSFTLHDAVLRVPWILRGPGVPRGAVVESVVSVADLAPTLLAQLGLPPLGAVDGQDLSPLLRGESLPERAVYAETLATLYEFGWSDLRALRSASHLYVRAPRPELYDMSADSAPRENLLDAGRREPVADALASQLETLLASESRPRPRALDAERRQRLEQLGYVLPADPVEPSGPRTDPKDGLRQLSDSALTEASAAFARGDLTLAESGLRRALTQLPRSARVHGLLGRVLLSAGRPQEALGYLEQAARLAPPSAGYQVQVGDARLALSDRAGALAAWERALAADPGDAAARAGLMLRALDDGDLEAAAGHAERALAGKPPGPSPLRMRVAENWERLGRFDRALGIYREVLESDPEAGVARFRLALQLVRLGRTAEAEGHLERAGPAARSPRARNRLGIAYAAAGESERAVAIFRELAEEYPEEESPRRNLAKLLAR